MAKFRISIEELRESEHEHREYDAIDIYSHVLDGDRSLTQAIMECLLQYMVSEQNDVLYKTIEKEKK